MSDLPAVLQPEVEPEDPPAHPHRRQAQAAAGAGRAHGAGHGTQAQLRWRLLSQRPHGRGLTQQRPPEPRARDRRRHGDR